MRVLAGKIYGGFIFRIGCLREKKKNMRLARFSLHFARNRMTPCVANHYTSTYFILSLLSDRLSLSLSLSLSLFGAGILEKKKRVRVT